MPSHQHEDFNPLLDTLLRFAKKSLAEQNAFLPFAAMMSGDGEISHVAGRTEEERPGASKVLGLLEVTLRGMVKKHDLRAAGICVDIRFASSPEEPKTDAIQVFLEHREGNVVNVLLPYQKVAPGEIRYGKLIAVRGERKLFVPVQ